MNLQIINEKERKNKQDLMTRIQCVIFCLKNGVWCIFEILLAFPRWIVFTMPEEPYLPHKIPHENMDI